MDKEDNMLLEEYSYIRTMQKEKAPDIKEAWQRFERKHLGKQKAHRTIYRNLFYRYAAAIAVFLILALGGTGLWWLKGGEQIVEKYKTRKYIHQVQNGNGMFVAFESTAAPQKIMMGCDGKPLKEVDKNFSCKEAKGDTAQAVFFCHANQILNIATRTIITPRGKIYNVVLSDGSEVVLNADSKLIFPVSFEGSKDRRVKLVGEAFFKVSKDSEHPFVVETPRLSTTVLGTEFDVRAYTDGYSRVTLLSGSVEISSDKESTVLVPGQEAILARNQYFDISNLGENVIRAIKWKEGFFSFHSTPLLEAIGDIGRWYNVDVEITDNSLKESTISLSMPRNVSLEDFVNSINLTKNLSAVLENGKILICPKNASKSTKLFSLYDALAEKQDVLQ